MSFDVTGAALLAELRAQAAALLARGDEGSKEEALQIVQGIADLSDSLATSDRITGYSTAATTTAAGGSQYTPLADGAANEIVIKNITGTTIEIQPASGGTSFDVADQEDLPLPVLGNSNEWQIRRKDLSTTQVSVRFLRILR